jgi:hypothetical protein
MFNPRIFNPQILETYISPLVPARVAASGLQRKFTGSPLFNEEKGEYFPDDSPSLEYIGSSPAVDHAWKELVKRRRLQNLVRNAKNITNDRADRYFLLTDEEAQETWGDEYIEFWNEEAGGYLGG